MNSNERDVLLVGKILNYCDEIEAAKIRFGNSWEAFSGDKVFQNACGLCVLQIGELANQLSDDFKSNHATIPWKNIKGMRNVVAHNYGSISVQVLWETLTNDIPTLRDLLQNP